MQVDSSSVSYSSAYPQSQSSIELLTATANQNFNALLTNLGRNSPELISELTALLLTATDNLTLENFKSSPIVEEIIELVSSAYIKHTVAMQTGFAAPVPYATSGADEQNGSIDYYSLTQLSFLAAILSYSLDQANLNLESAATLAEYMQFYELMTNLVNDLISFTTALNSSYKEILSKINGVQVNNGSVSSTLVYLADLNEIIPILFESVWEDYSNSAAVAPHYISIFNFIPNPSVAYSLESATLNPDGSVTATFSVYNIPPSGSWTLHTVDTIIFSSIDAYMAKLETFFYYDHAAGAVPKPIHYGDPTNYIKNMDDLATMQSGNGILVGDIPPSIGKYFSPYSNLNTSGYIVSVDGLNRMMADVSNALALVMPEYTETTFSDNWGQNILNSTGCEQMLSAVSGFNTTISQKATSTADKVGLLQDQISLARSLVSSFTDMVKQIINF